MYSVLLVIHTVIALAIILSVLVQRSDQDGFGLGSGGNSFMSSAAKANFLTRTTALLATAFMITSLILTMMGHRDSGTSIVDQIPVHSDVAPVDAPTAPAPEESAPAAPARPVVPIAE